MDVNPLITALVAMLGAGGLTQIFLAIKSYREGHAQRETEADERLITRMETQIEKLQTQLDLAHDYIQELVDALIEAGIKVPRRRRRR